MTLIVFLFTAGVFAAEPQRYEFEAEFRATGISSALEPLEKKLQIIRQWRMN